MKGGYRMQRIAIMAGVLLLLAGQSAAHEYDTAAHHTCARCVAQACGHVLEEVACGQITTAEPSVVIDTKYNLMWERKSCASDSPHYIDRLFTWQEARAYAEELNAAGYAGRKDWRVPSAMEMATLVDIGVGSPAIDREAFPLTGNRMFWTISFYSFWEPLTQYTSFNMGNQFKWNAGGLMRVRCVAGGGWKGRYDHGGSPDDPADIGFYEAQFTVIKHNLADGTPCETVIDNITGLEWEQKAWSSQLAWGPETLAAINDELDLLYRIIPFAAGFISTLLIDDFKAGGFFEDQKTKIVPDFIEIVPGLTGWLQTLYIDLAAELESYKAAGIPVIGPRSFLRLYDYDEAEAYIDYLNALDGGAGFAGHNDWRLPSVEEIITTTDWNRIPCVKEIFTPTFGWLFWTRTHDPECKKHYWT